MLSAEMRPRLSPEAGYRYGVVLLFAFASIIFFIVTPDRPLTRALGVLLAGGMLAIAVVTGRGAASVRRWRATAVVVLAIAATLAAGFEVMPSWIGAGVGCLLVVGTIAELAGGASRMLRSHGVTIQAVSAALAIYLLLGLFFALAVAVAAHAGSAPFFAQGTDGSQSQHVYYAFTTMTTTGYGDLTPAGSAGRAMAVVAMLIGQIYLVTVIAMLVSNFHGRRRE